MTNGRHGNCTQAVMRTPNVHLRVYFTFHDPNEPYVLIPSCIHVLCDVRAEERDMTFDLACLSSRLVSAVWNQSEDLDRLSSPHTQDPLLQRIKSHSLFVSVLLQHQSGTEGT